MKIVVDYAGKTYEGVAQDGDIEDAAQTLQEYLEADVSCFRLELEDGGMLLLGRHACELAAIRIVP